MRNRPRGKAVLSLKLFKRYYIQIENNLLYDGNRKEFSSRRQLLYAESFTLKINNEDGN